MTSLQTALWTAALVLLGKIVLDLRAQFRDRQSIAAALAGELRASIDLLNAPNTWTELRQFAALSRDDRISRLRECCTAPCKNHTFDRIADRIGRLPAIVAGEVSRTYSIIAGFRTLITNLSSPDYCDASDPVQSARLSSIAERLETELPRSLSLIESLVLISEQPFVLWLLRVNPLPENLD